MPTADERLDRFMDAAFWRSISPGRRRPLVEHATIVLAEAGSTLFQQFHPARRFYLLLDGTATQSTAGSNALEFGPVDWPYAALGWSGFLRPNRYGSSALAETDLELLCFEQDQLSGLFYSDPELAVRFFDLVLSSVRRQLVNLRKNRVAVTGALFDPPKPGVPLDRRPVVGRADNCLRRTAFFAPFDESLVSELASEAELESFQPGTRIARQGDETGGLLVLASGNCSASFESDDPDSGKLLPFRRFRGRQGIVAGLPLSGSDFAAEATVYAETHCWVYRIPSAHLAATLGRDPENARAFQQRLLARMAGLIEAMRMAHDVGQAQPEVAAVANVLSNSRARLPVTSQLHKVPHLLANRLTVANALAAIRQVGETGKYHERLLAARCDELLTRLAAEQRFYQGILEACEYVMSEDESSRTEQVRDTCDRMVSDAFDCLDTRVSGLDNLPEAGGNIIVLNHLSCPEYYQLPNDYHFSFDTAFVSCLIWRRYRRSAIRVVRQSPDSEFGHNIFYRRLGHITVPTVESGLDNISDEQFRAMRREAAIHFSQQGRKALAAGENVIICPEGQSQPAENSPAEFHAGAFRLAAETGARIVPVALAGFERRFKDGPLVAMISEPCRVPRGLDPADRDALRAFIDAFRERFTVSVRQAQALAYEPLSL